MSTSNGDGRAALQRGLAIAFAVLGGASTYVLIIGTSLRDAGALAAQPLPAQSGVINMRTPQAPQATQAPASRPPQIPLLPESPLVTQEPGLQAKPPSPVPPLLPAGPDPTAR